MIAFADPTLSLPTAMEFAEDRLGTWLGSTHGREVRVERPDGRAFHATAYERDAHWRSVPIATAVGDTQCLAIEELALRGVQEDLW